MGAPKKQPLYVLPHGIEVVGEYAPTSKNRYWRVRIRPHPFFASVKVRYGGIYVRRSRVVLASQLGRPLRSDELAHHGDEDKQHDTASNLELLSASEHNRIHKTGSTHTEAARREISQSLRAAYRDGRRARPQIIHRDQQGRIAKP